MHADFNFMDETRMCTCILFRLILLRSQGKVCVKTQAFGDLSSNGKKTFCQCQNKDLSEAADSSRLNSSRCDNQITALNL